MDNRVIELAEKIYANEVCNYGGIEGVNHEWLEVVAEHSITAAQVFYGVKKNMMMEVKEGER